MTIRLSLRVLRLDADTLSRRIFIQRFFVCILTVLTIAVMPRSVHAVACRDYSYDHELEQFCRSSNYLFIEGANSCTEPRCMFPNREVCDVWSFRQGTCGKKWKEKIPCVSNGQAKRAFDTCCEGRETRYREQTTCEGAIKHVVYTTTDRLGEVLFGLMFALLFIGIIALAVIRIAMAVKRRSKSNEA